jgi:hypothetical protein
MNALEYFGGVQFVTGGPSLALIPGRRIIHLDAGDSAVALQLPDPQDLEPGAEHWRVFVTNGSLVFGNVTFQPAGIPVAFGYGLTLIVPPLNPAGDWPLVDVNGLDSSIPSQQRGTPSPFVTVDGIEVEVTFQFEAYAEAGEVLAGQWLSISYAGELKGQARWVYQVGSFESLPALDSTPGLLYSHGIDGVSAPSNAAFRLDTGIALWQTLPAAGTPRSNAGAFGVETFSQDTHFICGGTVAGTNCEKYLLNTWGAVAAMPGAVSFAASWDALAVGLVHGGAESHGQLLQHTPTVGLGVWTTKSSSIQGRNSHTGGRLGGAPSAFAYLSGGGLAQSGSLLQRYQAGADVWGLGPHRPSGTAIGGVSASYVSDQGVGARLFMGGRYQWQGQDLPDTSSQVLELVASPVESWRTMPQAQSPVADAAAAGANGRVYVSGGGASSPTAVTHSFGPLDVWRKEPDSPVARSGLRAHATAGRSQA